MFAEWSAPQTFENYSLNKPIIPRGLGRSYGDCALFSSILSTENCRYFHEFDEEKGILICDSGVSLATILSLIVPKGWFLSVTPGTKFVTVGGAIAANVHGKNHHQCGSFGEHTLEIGLWLPDSGVVECSRYQRADLFHATCGGMGLTGAIVWAKLQLIPIGSSWIEQTQIRTRDLSDTLETLQRHATSTYTVAWIDTLATGKDQGRGWVMVGEHSDNGDYSFACGSHLSVPNNTPNLLNRFSIKLFNDLYRRYPKGNCLHACVPLDRFFYPLDRIHAWNRLYGQKGFLQYQCVVPFEGGDMLLKQLLFAITNAGLGAFLSVLKILGQGAASPNSLSFPISGYTLALDLPNAPITWQLSPILDAIVRDGGGRVYLAKDALLSKSNFQIMYPNFSFFQRVREKYQVLSVFRSLQSQRLGLSE
jgi:FAD/FMN-containing dehydrogenase